MLKRYGLKPDSASNFRFRRLSSHLDLTQLRLVVSDRKHIGGQTKQTRVSRKQGIENHRFIILKENATSVALCNLSEKLFYLT